MILFKKFIIYYFSGTGNSRNVALWISAEASKFSIECQIINIAETDRLVITKPPSDALIIFISPVHGFNYPPVVLNFIMRFPSGKNKVLLMNTRAGMLIGKFITPGLTGAAFLYSSLVLKLKGYSITGMVPFDLPSNWISVHPGLNERTIKYIHSKVKERVNKSIDKVIEKGTDFKALREILQDIIVSPVSVLYYFIGRFCFSKSYYASRDCNSCDLCIKQCPVKAIIKVNNRPFWTFRCESCMKCMSYCPKKAIETAHGYFLGIILLYSVSSGVFFNYFNTHFFNIKDGFTRFIIDNSIFILLLAVTYRIAHYLMRFKLFERLMVYTSLTKYRFWGRRYRAISDKDPIQK